MTNEEQIIREHWEQICLHIQEEYGLSAISFKTWILPLTVASVNDHVVTVNVHSDQSYMLKYITERYTAFFEVLPPTMYTLTAVSADASMGTVEGSGSYEAGSQVEIRAIAATGYHFTLWHDGNTDNPRTVTVNTDITYTAYFVANTGIGDVEERGVTLGVSGRTIMVGGAQAAFYDMLGRRLGIGSELTVEAAGVYLVRIGVKTYKVVIK